MLETSSGGQYLNEVIWAMAVLRLLRLLQFIVVECFSTGYSIGLEQSISHCLNGRTAKRVDGTITKVSDWFDGNGASGWLTAKGVRAIERFHLQPTVAAVQIDRTPTPTNIESYRESPAPRVSVLDRCVLRTYVWWLGTSTTTNILGEPTGCCRRCVQWNGWNGRSSRVNQLPGPKSTNLPSVHHAEFCICWINGSRIIDQVQVLLTFNRCILQSSYSVDG